MRVLEPTFVIGNDGALLLKLTMIETAEAIYERSRTREKQTNTPPAINAKGIKVAKPSFSPEAGELDPSDFPVTCAVTTLTNGATIRRSLSAIPATPTDGTAYITPLTINGGDTLYARAFKTGYEASEPAVGAFVGA